MVRVVDVHVCRQTAAGAVEWLLLRRSAGKVYAGSWRMVGGKIAPDESAWAAALRELREETGFVPLRAWSVPVVTSFYEPDADRVNLIPVFCAEVAADANPTLDDEHDAFCYLPLADALTRLDWPGQRLGLTEAARSRGTALAEQLRIPPP